MRTDPEVGLQTLDFRLQILAKVYGSITVLGYAVLPDMLNLQPETRHLKPWFSLQILAKVRDYVTVLDYAGLSDALDLQPETRHLKPWLSTFAQHSSSRAPCLS
ncbi:MAG: hypothetical protein WCP31_03885 [Chloroflexales bacterium]